MRMIVIKQATDLPALGARLLGAGAAHEGALQGLQRLNPHVDFGRLEPGTVLLVPDQPGLCAGESRSVSGEAFDAFEEQVNASVNAAVARVRSGHEALAAQRQEVAALLKSAAVRRLIESDPDLKQELDAAAQVFKQDQQQAKEAEKTMQLLQEQAKAELAALAKLLG